MGQGASGVGLELGIDMNFVKYHARLNMISFGTKGFWGANWFVIEEKCRIKFGATFRAYTALG